MKRRVASVLIVPSVLATSFALTATATAAVVHHPTAGSYDIYIGGSPGTMVLLSNHTVGPQGSTNNGTWSIQKGVVTVDSQGGEAPPQDCGMAGLPFLCYFNDVLTGPKTRPGIASQSKPGTATAYLGSYEILSEPYYAVRTGGAGAG